MKRPLLRVLPLILGVTPLTGSAFTMNDYNFIYEGNDVPPADYVGWNVNDSTETGVHLTFHGYPHSEQSECWGEVNGGVRYNAPKYEALSSERVALGTGTTYSPKCAADYKDGMSFARLATGPEGAAGLYVQTGVQDNGLYPFFGPQRESGGSAATDNGHSSTTFSFRLNPQQAGWPSTYIRPFAHPTSSKPRMIVINKSRLKSLQVPVNGQSASYRTRVALINRECWESRGIQKREAFGYSSSVPIPKCQLIVQMKWAQKTKGAQYNDTDAYAYGDGGQNGIPVIHGFVGARGETTSIVSKQVHSVRGWGDGSMAVWKSFGTDTRDSVTPAVVKWQAEVFWESGHFENIVDAATRVLTNTDEKNLVYMEYYFGGGDPMGSAWRERTNWYALDVNAAVETTNPFWQGSNPVTDQVHIGVKLDELRVLAR